jgi:hypothetical protein
MGWEDFSFNLSNNCLAEGLELQTQIFRPDSAVKLRRARKQQS